jgi:predicted DNA-binding transcriptional regulator YafY
MNLLKEKLVNGSYAINPDFEEFFYSEETKKNIALVASLRGLLQQYKGTPLFDSVTKLIYFLLPAVAKKDAVLSSGRVVVSPQMEFDINVRNWDRVYQAIQKNQKVRFRYTKSYTNQEIQRVICPYQLILENGSVYVWAYSDYVDDIFMYDLNFMADVVVLNEKFDLPENFDINNYSGGGRLGAFAGDKVEKFKIRFTGYAKEWIKNHKWADDQTFIEDEESTTITFSSSQFEKVFESMLSWGRQAEPLAPARLVKRWKEEILAMAEKVK